MIKILKLLFVFLIYSSLVSAQNLTQTIRGNISDIDSNLPMIGVEVILPHSQPIVGTITDEQGRFRLENIPIGRYELYISYLGYESQLIPNVIVNSGKEVILELLMQESSIKLESIEVIAEKNKGDALNEMAMISSRSVSPEETSRYAGGFNDPSRIMSNFAGVTSTQDGGNDIIVRGNSPKYIQWRLEGMQITNPNHFGDQSAVGGSVSTLNNNILAKSDFYTGAFTSEYGDVLSGVYDVKLRAGNNEKFEKVFGFGILGTDLTLEGPIKKGNGSSFLVNYRYSTAGMASDLGLLGDIGGVPTFQDAAFKLVMPTKKLGLFSAFGLGGLSSFLFEDVSPSIWETPGETVKKLDVVPDYNKDAYLMNVGLNHSISLSENSYLKSGILYSKESVTDQIFESQRDSLFNSDGAFLSDTLHSKTIKFDNDLLKTSLRFSSTYNLKINPKHKIQLGVKYARIGYDINQNTYTLKDPVKFNVLDFEEHATTLRSFVSWKYQISNSLTMIAGTHSLSSFINRKNSIEPRLALNWQINRNNSVGFAYGKHSSMESIHHYFSNVENADGQITQPNSNLGLLKSRHFVVSYERKLGKNMRAKLETYYQGLYDLPVENLDTSHFATINEGLNFRYLDLVNEGTGKNYGVELTLEKFFSNQYYFLINASIFESKYKTLENRERNTQYNGNYLLNVLCGKEFENLGKNNNHSLTLNAKAFFGGGKKIIPILRDSEGNVAVNSDSSEYYDYEKAYDQNLEDVYNITISASYKWNKKRSTHELFLNLDNITNKKARVTEYYDENEEGSIGYLTQFGIFPNLMYRVYF